MRTSLSNRLKEASMFLHFNGRYSAYLVEDSNKVGPFFFKDGIEEAMETAATLNIGVAIGFKFAAKVANEELPPDGGAIGFRVQLKTKHKDFELLPEAMAYRDRYGSEETPITEVLL
jgi:hypothetical protein